MTELVQTKNSNKTDEEWEKLIEEEIAWLFYESGVQDMREIKRLYSVFKF